MDRMDIKTIMVSYQSSYQVLTLCFVSDWVSISSTKGQRQRQRQWGTWFPSIWSLIKLPVEFLVSSLPFSLSPSLPCGYNTRTSVWCVTVSVDMCSTCSQPVNGRLVDRVVSTSSSENLWDHLQLLVWFWLLTLGCLFGLLPLHTLLWRAERYHLHSGRYWRSHSQSNMPICTDTLRIVFPGTRSKSVWMVLARSAGQEHGTMFWQFIFCATVISCHACPFFFCPSIRPWNGGIKSELLLLLRDHPAQVWCSVRAAEPCWWSCTSNWTVV